MPIQVLNAPVTVEELKRLAADQFGDFVKAVVDVGRSVMAIGGELHADEEAVLLQQGARQADLWGINLYPDRPGVEDPAVQRRIRAIVETGRPVMEPLYQHRDLAAGRWGQLSLTEQLGNVGSEVGRMLRSRGRDDRLMWNAFDRALELLDLTLADLRWRDRLREIARAREVLCDAAAAALITPRRSRILIATFSPLPWRPGLAGNPGQIP